MNEADDRMAGDPVWELFPLAAPPVRRNRTWLIVALLAIPSWLIFPPLAVLEICLAVAARDIRGGRRLARSIPDKAGGAVCSRFAYAWGAWKLGTAGFVLVFVVAVLAATTSVDEGRREVPPAAMAAMSTALALGAFGFTASALLTTSGLFGAYRSGMRVWIGEGVNQARTLLLAMLIVGFTYLVFGPTTVWMVSRYPTPEDTSRGSAWILLWFVGCLFVAPIVMLLILDWFARRIIADRPGKYGPKVPTVGKWDL